LTIRQIIGAGAGLVLGCLLTGAVSMTGMPSHDADSPRTNALPMDSCQIETLMGFRVDGAALHFRVATGGCTTVDDFRLEVEPRRPGTEHVTMLLRRVRADSCKGYFPDGTEITFDGTAHGIAPGQPMLVRNPFGAYGGC
jgi:hypothetical protein